MASRNYIFILLCWFSLLSNTLSANETTSKESIRPKPPEINVNSYVLVDFRSGIRLVEKNATKRIEPASITKLMTAYLLYEALKEKKINLTDKVFISEKAWNMKGSRMFVETGKKVLLKKMLKGLIIQSGNDAAVALAEHLAGSEASFVDLMNKKAKQLGMNDTHFVNSTGWPAENHYTTANDIIKLVGTLIEDYPEHYKMYSIKNFSYNGIKQYNRNKLLWKDKSVDGVKTGHTESAGFCLVASAKRENMRLISIILGAKNEKERLDYAQQLLEYGFRFYEIHKLYDKYSVLSETKIWKGEKSTIPLGTVSDIWVSIQKGRYKNLRGSMQINKGIDAPINRGDVLGKLVLQDGKMIVNTYPLIALDSVEEGGIWSHIVDTLYKFFSE